MEGIAGVLLLILATHAQVEECEIDMAGSLLSLVFGSPEVGDIMEVECSEPGLEMVGESLFNCVSGKEWDPKPPYCVGPGAKPPQCENVTEFTDTVAVAARGDFCYSFINSNKQFYPAQKVCEHDGGYLVTIPDEETNDWLVETLSALNKFDWGNAGVWLGLKKMDRQWKWIEPSNPVPLSSYGFNNRKSPWHYIGHCQYLSMDDSDAGTWWDAKCSLGINKDKYKVVCQYPLGK